MNNYRINYELNDNELEQVHGGLGKSTNKQTSNRSRNNSSRRSTSSYGSSRMMSSSRGSSGRSTRSSMPSQAPATSGGW